MCDAYASSSFCQSALQALLADAAAAIAAAVTAAAAAAAVASADSMVVHYSADPAVANVSCLEAGYADHLNVSGWAPVHILLYVIVTRT